MSYVQVINMDKSFQGRQILKSINLEIQKGEFVTLLGPSGCGKTTLLRIIAGLEQADAGKVIVNGQEIREDQNKKRQNIGMVFQSYALFPNLTAFENIAFGLKIKRVAAADIRKQVAEIMDILSITGKENNYPHQMSGGQQQRVALARALVVKPDLLLLDEPLSAVDAKVRESARTLIRDVQRKTGITTIFVTHDQLEALVMSDRIAVISNGELMQYGTPEQIYHQPANKFVAQFIGTYNFLPGSLLDFPEAEEVCVRPEHISLVGKEQLTAAAEPDMIGLEGTLENFYILGNTVRAEVLVQGKTISVDHLNRFEGPKFTLNEKVGLLVAKKACTVLDGRL